QAKGTDKWLVARIIRQEMRALCSWTQQPGFPEDTVAIFGVTLLARAAARMGFDIRCRPAGLLAGLQRLYFQGLLAIYSSEGLDRLALGRTVSDLPAEAWISVSRLQILYGVSHATSGG
ncbi:MAG TPA: hypothetical protein VFB34_01955, partial [Chloroflexota bacterium]|nr:hypothetical protein [Chloroflexota bacterium]